MLLKKEVALKIGIILKNKPMTLSFEFFPPKKVENERGLFDTIEVLKDYNPDFVSITYGAGGSTRSKTVEWTIRMKEVYHLNPMMHLTCISSTERMIDEIVETLKKHSIDNILALRGDIPEGFDKTSMEFGFAYQLVEYLKKKGDFSIGVAGYPEGHPEAESLDRDVEYLKRKVDAGADFVITQLFFDNRRFFEYMDRLGRHGIDIPVIAGIMPIVNLSQMRRFVDMCGVSVPDGLVKRMEGKGAEDMYKIGVEYAISQCEELIESRVRGLHFYTLNRFNATKDILDGLGLNGG